MDNNDDNLNPMPTEAPVETPTETPAPEAPIDIETTDEPAPADAPVEAPAEETPAEPEVPAEETPVEETPAEPEAPAEALAEEAPAETPIEETAPIEPSVPVETPVEPTEPVIESAPIDMAAPVAPAETPKKKSKAGLIIAAIALIVILSGAIIAILIISNTPTAPNKGGNNSNNNSNSNNSQVVEEEEEEVALDPGNDAATIAKMDEVMQIVFVHPGNRPLLSFSATNTYNKLLINGTAKAHQKLENIAQYIASVTSSEKETGNYTYAKALNKADYQDSEDLTKYYGEFSTREQFFESTLFIPEEKVADLYFSVFGEEVTHESADKLCGGLYYDAKHKGYYYGPLNACGWAYGSALELARVGHAKQGNTYYADYQISYSDPKESVFELHAGADEKTEVIKSVNLEDDCMEQGAIATCLTAEEKAKVKTYRFVFEKDGDNFFFKEVVEKQ